MDQSFTDPNTDEDEEDEDSAHQANAFFQSLKPSSPSQAQPADRSNNAFQLNATQRSDQTTAFFQSLKPTGSSQGQPADPSDNPFPPITMQLSDPTQPGNRTDDFFRSLRRSLASQDDSASAEATPEIIPGLRSVLSRGQPALMGQVNTSAPAAAGGAQTPEIIPGLRAADSQMQPGGNPRVGGPTSQGAQNPPSAVSPGIQDQATPAPTAPQPSPSVITVGDDDIDRALDTAYSNIVLNKFDRGFRPYDHTLPDYWNYLGTMYDVDTHAFGEDKFYRYEGDKYPLLKGKTFSGPDLNYLGVGAGFAAGGFPRFVAKLGAYWWKRYKKEYGNNPSPEALAAEEAGWQAYWNSRAYKESPYWRQHRTPQDVSTHPAYPSDTP
jgi:hypothetical protein